MSKARIKVYKNVFIKIHNIPSFILYNFDDEEIRWW